MFGVSFTPDDRWIIACGRSTDVSIFDSVSGARISTIPSPHPRTIESLAITADGKYLATAGSDGAICLYEFETQKWRTVERAHIGAATCVRFTKDDQYLVSGGRDACIYVCDVATGAHTHSYALIDSISSLAIDSLNQIVCGDRGGVITRFQPFDNSAVEGCACCESKKCGSRSKTTFMGSAASPMTDH